METIGLKYNDMVNLLAHHWEVAREAVEAESQAIIQQKIESGYSKDRVELQSEVIAELSSASSAMLAVITENNKRILGDLRKAGIL